ncbi:CHASE domain-containing protein [bacterium]|nr:CHASE domain-containing protein [bacterium]
MPFILLLVLTVITYQYYKTIRDYVYLDHQTEFALNVQKIKTHIEERMLAYENVLNSTRGFFLASGSVSRSEFKVYIDALMLDKTFPGIQGVGYAVIVPSEKKDAFVEEVRAQGFGSYGITPTTPRDFYTTIIYLEPFEYRNQRAFGYDMFTNPKRREAMELSRDNSTAVISSKVTLLQEDGIAEQAGFLMYLPVFKNNTENKTVKERRKNIIGWIYAPFRMNDFMRGITDEKDKNFDIEIYDNGIVNDKTLMYDGDMRNESPLFSRQVEINIADHNWTLLIKSTSDFEKSVDTSKATLILIFGFLFSIALVYIIWQLISHKEYAEIKAVKVNKELISSKNKLKNLNITLERRVEEKTLALQTSNEILEAHIADLNVLNSQLIKAKEEAQQAEQAKSNFVSGISHELRTPLNAIINFTDQVVEDFEEMLVDKELQEDTKVFLKRVIVNSRHLLQLINDLLEFTKAEAGKMEYKIERNDINPILSAAYNNTYSLLNGTDVKFHLILSEKPLTAMVDARRFLQILLNLLSNAIKFTKHGYVELRSFLEDENIIVEVEDTGKGIPQNKQKIIFEPFMQVDSADNGTGLGLGLVKRMCDDMDIKVSLDSSENIGTTFRLTIKKLHG